MPGATTLRNYPTLLVVADTARGVNGEVIRPWRTSRMLVTTAATFPAPSPAFRAKHGPVRGEPKAQVTLRIDQDVLDCYENGGKGC